jgi:hypothetical protein
MSILTTSAAAIAVTLIATYGIGQFTSESIQTQIEIDAPASAVWEVLSDTASYPTWNPFVKKISGDLVEGNHLTVTIQSEGNSPMDFAPLVLAAEENQELRWVGHLGFKGVFDGEHHYIIEETADGKTLFRHGETFSGMLAYVLFPLIGEDTETGFRA